MAKTRQPKQESAADEHFRELERRAARGKVEVVLCGVALAPGTWLTLLVLHHIFRGSATARMLGAALALFHATIGVGLLFSGFDAGAAFYVVVLMIIAISGAAAYVLATSTNITALQDLPKEVERRTRASRRKRT